MAARFVLYGLFGWCAEIVWTALYDLVTNKPRDLRLVGHTYLWMLPIYGSAAFAFEPVHDALRGWPMWARGLVYVPGIFAVEYLAGFVLKHTTGKCPWDYSYARFHVHGYIRLDYVPVWFVFALALERVHDGLVAATPVLVNALW